MSAQDQQERPPRILVVDDNVSLCRPISTILKVEGFEPLTITDPEAAVGTALDFQPDLILLDVMMPRLDGLEICRRLRALRQTRYSSVILVTAKVSTVDKVAGLRAGADDYLTKPFDSGELVERVRSALRRSAEMKGLNPLTGLPGNEQIRIEMRGRLAAGSPIALLHVDMDNFKAFNDHYGFLRGDEAIALLADCLKRAAPETGAEGFVGHVGGDDFVLIVPHDLAENTAKQVIANWDEHVRTLYDPVDLERGFIEVMDRRRNLSRFPPLTISIGIASTRFRSISSELEMADIAAEMKREAKTSGGSSWAIDRRQGEPIEESPPRFEGHPVLLVVDDEPDVRSMVRMALEERFDILEAADGMEAYIVASNRRPQWVLLDYMMPELNGRYAADLIRERVPEAHIIAFSAALDERPEWAEDLILKSAPLAPTLDRIVQRLSASPPPPVVGHMPDDEQMKAILQDRYLRHPRAQEPSEPVRED